MLAHKEGGGEYGDRQPADEQTQGKGVFLAATDLCEDEPVVEAVQGGEEVVRGVNGI